jgi:hypothetical protein
LLLRTDLSSQGSARPEAQPVTEPHVALLRRLAAGERIPPEWLTRAETPVGLDDLVGAGLAAWDAGAGKRAMGHVVTPAGRAALLFFDLGRGAA